MVSAILDPWKEVAAKRAAEEAEKRAVVQKLADERRPKLEAFRDRWRTAIEPRLGAIWLFYPELYSETVNFDRLINPIPEFLDADAYNRSCARAKEIIGKYEETLKRVIELEEAEYGCGLDIGPPPINKKSARTAQFEQRRSLQFKAWYKFYLRSEKWIHKRIRVLERAHGKCEGCGNCDATQIHHLTYDHVGDELLFELAAVCDDCHNMVHGRERGQS